jgi:hypothetical protein
MFLMVAIVAIAITIITDQFLSILCCSAIEYISHNARSFEEKGLVEV